jgi:hypothetical protein
MSISSTTAQLVGWQDQNGRVRGNLASPPVEASESALLMSTGAWLNATRDSGEGSGRECNRLASRRKKNGVNEAAKDLSSSAGGTRSFHVARVSLL